MIRVAAEFGATAILDGYQQRAGVGTIQRAHRAANVSHLKNYNVCEQRAGLSARFSELVGAGD